MKTDQDLAAEQAVKDAEPLVFPRGEHWHSCNNCKRLWPCPRAHPRGRQCMHGFVPGHYEVEVCGECTFVLVCAECDAGPNVADLLTALKEGWTGLDHDPFAGNWTWIGLCPDCKKMLD